jgi:hypothetical protein
LLWMEEDGECGEMTVRRSRRKRVLLRELTGS